MKLIGLGGCKEVGRSAFIIKEKDLSVLLDYGVKIFSKRQDKKPQYPLNINIKPDIALISHAHLDHVGYVPHLFKNNRLMWYSTPPTLDIANVLWKDNIKIMKSNNEKLPYNKANIKKANLYWHPVVYNELIKYKDIKFMFRDAGHILGSSQIEMEWNNKKIVYTGDFKGIDTRLHKAAKPLDADILIIESTYADKDHPDRKELEKAFIKKVNENIEEGVALIAAFAVGRTQELLLILRKYIKDVPIYIDGMGKDISNIYAKYIAYIKDHKKFVEALHSATLVNDKKTRKKAIKEGNIILTTAGMLDGGPVLSYLYNLPKHSQIFLTGYQVEGTNGRLLLEKGRINIDDYEVEVPFDVNFFDFSAHAGKKYLFDYVKKSNPEKVITIHGDKENTEGFANALKEEGFDAVSPNIKQVIKL